MQFRSCHTVGVDKADALSGFMKLSDCLQEFRHYLILILLINVTILPASQIQLYSINSIKIKVVETLY